ncbi:NFACT family protein [archaeon]
MPLSNLEVHWAVQEMQCIVGTHFDKISDLSSGWKLKFGKQEIAVEVPERMHLTWHKQPASAPHGFTQYCRKHLHGKVVKVWQPGFDRVVVIELDSGQKIVFELFSKGNAIMVGADGKTEKTFRGEEWKDRVLKRGEEYSFPKSKKLDPREMAEKEFVGLFGEKDVIHSLAAGINMSGKYLELACVRAGVDKNASGPGKKLFGEIKKMLEEYEPGIDTVPVVQKFSDSFEPKETFSEALDECFATTEADTTASQRVARKIASQEKAIKEMREKRAAAKEKGDAVYSNWQELEELMENVKKWREKGKSFDEINQMLAGKASINKKTHKMTVKL